MTRSVARWTFRRGRLVGRLGTLLYVLLLTVLLASVFQGFRAIG